MFEEPAVRSDAPLEVVGRVPSACSGPSGCICYRAACLGIFLSRFRGCICSALCMRDWLGELVRIFL